MASDDEIRPMIEHEEPVDVKVEEGTSSNQNINDAVVKTSSSAASASEEDATQIYSLIFNVSSWIWFNLLL